MPPPPGHTPNPLPTSPTVTSTTTTTIQRPNRRKATLSNHHIVASVHVLPPSYVPSTPGQPRGKQLRNCFQGNGRVHLLALTHGGRKGTQAQPAVDKTRPVLQMAQCCEPPELFFLIPVELSSAHGHANHLPYFIAWLVGRNNSASAFRYNGDCESHAMSMHPIRNSGGRWVNARHRQ